MRSLELYFRDSNLDIVGRKMLNPDTHLPHLTHLFKFHSLGGEDTEPLGLNLANRRREGG